MAKRKQKATPGNVKEKAFGPAAEGFGQEIAPLGNQAGKLASRVGTLLIRALEPLVYGLERSADWIEKSVSERLASVEPEKIVGPDPRIAVPAMQALTYSLGDKVVREMFANLLAADMNSDTKSLAHPSFVEIIREMGAVDARLLRSIASHRPNDIKDEKRRGFLSMSRAYNDKWDALGTELAERYGLEEGPVRVALSNLDRLGLVDVLASSWEWQTEPYVFFASKRVVDENNETLRYGVRVTPLGHSFLTVCLPEKQ